MEDSDSTGVATRNIFGSQLGYEAIGEQWKMNLEMKGILLEVSNNLCYGCEIYEDQDYVDEDWDRKNCEGYAR